MIGRERVKSLMRISETGKSDLRSGNGVRISQLHESGKLRRSISIVFLSQLSLSASLLFSFSGLAGADRNAYTRPSSSWIVQSERFRYFGVRLTDNNVSSGFRWMAPLPRPRHRGADFSLLRALKNQPPTRLTQLRTRIVATQCESASRTHTCVHIQTHGIPLCDLTRTSADQGARM